jgi:hypothetical protein
MVGILAQVQQGAAELNISDEILLRLLLRILLTAGQRGYDVNTAHRLQNGTENHYFDTGDGQVLWEEGKFYVLIPESVPEFGRTANQQAQRREVKIQIPATFVPQGDKAYLQVYRAWDAQWGQ